LIKYLRCRYKTQTVLTQDFFLRKFSVKKILFTYFIKVTEIERERNMKRGSEPWNRSNVMLVGEGRVGKTALCRSLMGKPFIHTESTVGLNQLTCDVKLSISNDGRWTKHLTRGSDSNLIFSLIDFGGHFIASFTYS